MGGPDSLKQPLLAVGLPPDAVAWSAFAAAAIGILVSPFARRWFGGERRALQLSLLLALCAALLSAGYVAVYLRGGPRIVDATSYWLEGRSLAEGRFAFSVPDPTAAFRGRFLVTPEAGSRLSVIFPPGYPALLALGFRLGAPLAVGPLIAAALVVATFALCRELFGRADIALLAACFSTISAALRYHTADTMSHGWSALLLTVVLLACFRARRTDRARLLSALCAGLAGGWLVATRPVTGAVALMLGVLLLVPPARRSSSAAGIAVFCAGLVPGLALLLLHQRIATGSWLGSSQLRYYALSDGPSGCFRYGFGSGIGCLHEHGDFVRARLSDGFGLGEALLTTLRRLQHHALDIANFEPLAAVVLFAMIAGFRNPAVRWLTLGVVGTMLAYAPFYFDATYPGGGARFYADVLPLEHALLSFGLVRLRAAFPAVPLAFLGFAVHGVFSHRALAEREGGRPMFEPDVLDEGGIVSGLVFVDTDHGFNLGHLPQQHDPARGVVVARWRGDARDGALWDVLGRPRAYRYHFDPFARAAAPTLRAQSFDPPSVLRFEAEGDWPVLAISGGWAYPEHSPLSCASRGRGLRLWRAASDPVRLDLEVWSPRAATYDVRLSVLGSHPHPRVTVGLGTAPALVARGSPSPSSCRELSAGAWHFERGTHRLAVETTGEDGVVLDYVELRPAGASPRPKPEGL